MASLAKNDPLGFWILSTNLTNKGKNRVQVLDFGSKSRDSRIMNLKSFARNVSIGITAFAILLTGLATTASAGTFCADGTYSSSTGKGTCSWHGGILGGAPSKQNGYGSTTKSYGSSLNDPYGLNSYGSFGTKKCYSLIC